MCIFFNRLFILPQIEILFHKARIHQSLHQLWGNELVQLADCGAGPVGPVPDHGCVRLQEERLVRRDGNQGDQCPEHLQALLFEVGLQDNVLQGV